MKFSLSSAKSILLLKCLNRNGTPLRFRCSRPVVFSFLNGSMPVRPYHIWGRMVVVCRICMVQRVVPSQRDPIPAWPQAGLDTPGS